MAGPEAPTLDEWRRLYTLADQIKAMAPWQWMEEIDIFGVQSPETSELGFVSVMGMLGEHLAITVYRGGRAIEDFWRIQLDDTYFPPERIIELPQVQLSFEDRSELESDDHSVLKLLRLSYRGKQSWPMFRSYQPGYAPWYLDSAEARLLTWTLQQVLEVAPRFKEHEKELSPAVREQDLYLVRLPQRMGKDFVWHDEFLPAPKEEVIVDTLMDMAALDALKRRPAGKWKLEMDLVMLPAPIQENRSVRPRFPYFLMIVDSDSGYVFHSDIMTVDEETSLVDLWGRVPAEVVRALGKEEILRPTTVVVRTGLMREILERLSTELGFKLKRADELPALDEAKESFLDVLTRRRRP